MVVAEVLQRHRTSRIYRERTVVLGVGSRGGVAGWGRSSSLPSDAGDPGMLMT